ncbi:hypothetical protein [Corynebacterium hiratae]|uniref:Uncharacterized protein n=1 Tax=Corynebacterium aurimucosum TaxID=169292 RepID=A0A6I3KBK7_9CORY|nr:hypothetical protein [Corynebacterium aurimucosum]MTD91132.1 hypothetical protein [Corynebacterium aurimucosum]
MTPEDARYWLGHSTRPPLIPPYIAQEALETIAAMDYQEADYCPPRFYTVDEPIEKGPDLGDHVTRARRLVGEWEKA